MSPDDEKIKADGRPFMHLHIPIIHTYPIGYPLARVAGVDVPDEDGWHHEKSVKEYINEWSKEGIMPVFGYDITGNQGMKPLFENICVDGEEVTFSGPSKSGMYQRFKYYMEKGLLHRIPNKQWDYEARHIIMKKSSRGYMTVHHESEEDRDDCMDATAGLIYLTDSPDINEPSAMII